MGLAAFNRARREMAERKAAEEEAVILLAEELPVFEAMTIEEMKAFAAEEEIDVSAAKLKADYVTILTAAFVEVDTEDEAAEEEAVEEVTTDGEMETR